MTPALRKRHLRIWVILAFLLPVGFISAFLEKPEPIATVYEDSLSSFPSFGRILRDAEDQEVKVHLWEQTVPVANDSVGEDSAIYTLQIFVKKTLSVPSIQAYLSLDAQSEPIKTKLLLGKIVRRGKYHFELGQLPELPEKMYIILHDGIKNQTLKTIVL